jgi:tetratricopeptide (TPR) repeat protein
MGVKKSPLLALYGRRSARPGGTRLATESEAAPSEPGDGADITPPGRPRLGRVFISSAFRGMGPLRQRVAETARSLGITPVLTEALVGQPESVAEVLARELAACDTYVGLFAWWRGSVPSGVDAAITEKEYRRARAGGLRCLAFIDDSEEARRDPAFQRFLDEEVRNYHMGVYSRPYATEAQLAAEVTAALSALRPEVVLELGGPAGQGATCEARLRLDGVEPALGAPRPLVGPHPMSLALDAASAGVLHRFLSDAVARSRLSDAQLRRLGSTLWGLLPAEIAEALGRCLILARGAGTPLVLRVRTGRPEALALPWELLAPPPASGEAPGDLPVRRGFLSVVRHVTLVDDGAASAADPSPRLPRGPLAVLGFTADPLEDEGGRATVGPGGFILDHKLFWENEQERLLRALDSVLGSGRGRLVLPDTGDARELQAQLGRPDRPAIVHVSCHGGLIASATRPGAPIHALFLEDEDLHRRPTTAVELVSWMDHPGELDLVVLSACYTAASLSPPSGGRGTRRSATAMAPEGRVASLAEDLIGAGVPRVLGMQTSVSDHGATELAAAFYETLATGTDLVAALAAGRRALDQHGAGHEWAIPALYVRDHLGPLAAPPDTVPAQAGVVLEVVQPRFDLHGVSYLQSGYIGRRLYEHRIRRVYLDGARLIAIHGLGGIGKSTLAARFIERRRLEGTRAIILAPGLHVGGALLDEVARDLGVARPPGGNPAATEQAFRGALKTALVNKPTIVLLDNFEDNQAEESGALIDPALGEALGDLADCLGPGSCLLFTTRLALTLAPGLPEPANLDLGALSPAEARKLRLIRPGLRDIPADIWDEVMDVFGGHPKALELLGEYLRGSPDRLHTLLHDVESAVVPIDRKLRAERQQRGRKLLIDRVIEAVPQTHVPTLDRMCLLEAPLSTEELVALLESTGVSNPRDSLTWLRAHGMVAEAAAPGAIDGGDLVHRLVAQHRHDALGHHEGEDATRMFHRAAAEHFVRRSGPLTDIAHAARHLDAAGDRAGALDYVLRWASQLGKQHAYGAAVAVGRRGLNEFPPRSVAPERLAAANLWLDIFYELWSVGDLGEAAAALDRAEALIVGIGPPEVCRVRGGLELQRAVLLQQTGHVVEAEQCYASARDDFRTAGDEREAAIAMGGLADILAARGELDEALRIRREELIPVFEKLGDLSGQALTLSKIADVLIQDGQTEEGLRICVADLLPIFEKLGDIRSRAVTLSQIAAVLRTHGQLDEAVRILRDDVLPVFEKLGDIRQCAVTLGQISNALMALGQLDEAVRILRDDLLPVFEKLGDIRHRAVTFAYLALGLIGRNDVGDRAEANSLLCRALADFEALQTPEAGNVRAVLEREGMRCG